MDPSHLTQKSQEALRDAQTKALRFGHQEVDGEHLLLALLDQPEGIAPRLLSQTGADPGRLRKELEAELSRRPRVTGPGVQPGQVAITQRLARLLDTAQQSADRLKDEYVSVDHLLLALISEGPTTAAGRLLHDEGVTRDRFLEALTKIRGNQRVTSAMPESAYEALIKYGTDLVAEAWDVVVYLTDLPRRSGTQPVVADFSMTHAVALISLPAVGWVRLRRCVRDVVVYLLRRMAEERREHCQTDCGHLEKVGRRRLLP